MGPMRSLSTSCSPGSAMSCGYEREMGRRAPPPAEEPMAWFGIG
jgi:hypothetical protein